MDKPMEYLASVMINKPDDVATEDDPFDYIERAFDSLCAARLFCGRTMKQHPRAVGAANVFQQSWERSDDGVWMLMSEERVWER